MKKAAHTSFSPFLFGGLALFAFSAAAIEQEGSRDDAKRRVTMEKIQVHGGQGHISKKFCFETVFRKTEIRIYPYNANAEPILTVGLGGNIVLHPTKPGEPRRNLTLKSWKSQDKSVREYLYAAEDLSKALKGSFTAHITITGLQDDGMKEIPFEIPFLGLTPEVAYLCMKCEKKFVDPGDCPKCGAMLERKTAAEASDSSKSE